MMKKILCLSLLVGVFAIINNLPSAVAFPEEGHLLVKRQDGPPPPPPPPNGGDSEGPDGGEGPNGGEGPDGGEGADGGEGGEEQVEESTENLPILLDEDQSTQSEQEASTENSSA